MPATATATAIVDFRDAPIETARRRLADLPDRVLEGDPRHVTETRWESPDGHLVAGTWTSTPGRWRAFADRDEFCTILSGHVRLVSEDGTARSFRAGDSFLIPDGFRGRWEVLETTTKHFVIRRHPTTQEQPR
jgi:uncharacterized cupin superfamily protein